MPEPAPPILEISSDKCIADFGGNCYTLNVTHMQQELTTITVIEPNTAKDIVYSFSGNGCEIVYGDLSFETDKSYMSDDALPQIINEIFSNAQKQDALTYTDYDTPSASTLTNAIFNGQCSSFSYEILTDYESGAIKEISVDKYDLKIRFSYK